MPQIIVGRDLSRAFLDICIDAGKATSRIENTTTGMPNGQAHSQQGRSSSSRRPADAVAS